MALLIIILNIIAVEFFVTIDNRQENQSRDVVSRHSNTQLSYFTKYFDLVMFCENSIILYYRSNTIQ